MKVELDQDRLRKNVTEIAQTTGVDIYAVVKANGYGMGAVAVSEAIADLVAGWCVFSWREAAEARLWERTGKKSITLGPADGELEDYLRHGVRPGVMDAATARRLAKADPVVCVDTGMQRFACPVERVKEVVAAGNCREAFTHAIRIEQVKLLEQVGRPLGLKLHAAASALLGEPQAWLDAVRPGLAMYRGAVRVCAPLVEVRDSKGPVGYTGFSCRRHGVIVCGYSGGLKRGPCIINGQRRRVMEVGMQSAYVELGEKDSVGDEVVLLGDGLEAEDLGREWGCSGQEVLVRLGRV